MSNKGWGTGHLFRSAHTTRTTALTCEADEHNSSGQAGSDYTKTPDRSNITAFLTFASIWDTAQVQTSSRRFDAMEGPGESPAPGTTVQAKQTLRRLNHDWVAALISRNTDLLKTLMAEDCIFSYALDGDDRAQFISDIESGELTVDSLDRDTLEVRVYGSTGVVIAYDTADWVYKGRRIQGNYRIMHVYAERYGLWQIVAIQASPISS